MYYANTRHMSDCASVRSCVVADKQYVPSSPFRHSACPPLQYQCLLCGTSRLLSNESVWYKTHIDKLWQRLVVSDVYTLTTRSVLQCSFTSPLPSLPASLHTHNQQHTLPTQIPGQHVLCIQPGAY